MKIQVREVFSTGALCYDWIRSGAGSSVYKGCSEYACTTEDVGEGHHCGFTVIGEQLESKDRMNDQIDFAILQESLVGLGQRGTHVYMEDIFISLAQILHLFQSS